jgi:hypothetical protein
MWMWYICWWMWIWYICCCDLADVSTCECDISVGECESIFDLENDITAGLNWWWWVTNHSRLWKEPAVVSFITAGHQKNRLWYVPHYRRSANLAGCDDDNITAGSYVELAVICPTAPPATAKSRLWKSGLHRQLQNRRWRPPSSPTNFSWRSQNRLWCRFGAGYDSEFCSSGVFFFWALLQPQAKGDGGPICYGDLK